MSEPIMKKASGDGVDIQLAVWEGEGKNILCVHCLTANCRCWDNIAASLAPGHNICAMDLRGRGLSGKPDSGYSIEHHCRDILAVLDDLSIDRVVLMGHSLGAFISLGFGARHPDRVDRIVLFDGGGKLSEEQMAKVLAGIKPSVDRLGQVFSSFDAYLDLMKSTSFFQPWSAFVETYFQYEVEDVDGGVRSRVQLKNIIEEITNLGEVDASEFYPQISCPVLILRATKGLLADDDILLPRGVVENMTKALADARYVNIEGTNHYTLVFNARVERDDAIRSFLEQ